MAETAVQDLICDVCGAEIRDEALFCYNCGAQVRSAAVPSAQNDPLTGPEVAAKEESPSTNGSGSPVIESKRKTAADLRRKKRVLERKPVQVAWEGNDSLSPRFITASIVLTLIVLILIVLAFYLR